MTEEKRSDEDVLLNEPARFRLADKEFEFCEPGRRRCRVLLRRLAQIVKGSGYSLDELNTLDLDALATDMDAAIGMLGLCDEMLDFLYDAVPECGKHREYLNNKATEQEIGNAFAQVIEVLNRPFASTPRDG